MNSVDIMDQKALLKNKCNEIIQRCKTEVRDMTEDEQKEVEGYKEEIKQLNADLEELKKRLADMEEIEDEQEQEQPKENEEEEKGCENEEEENKRNIENDTTMKKEFRLLSAINDIANNRQLSKEAQSVCAQGAAEMRGAGQSFGGQIQLPTENRTISVTATNGSTVETLVGDILEPLRSKSVLAKAGAKFIENLRGDVKIPVVDGGVCTWEGETGSASEMSGTTISNVLFQPKRLTAKLTLSKQFLAQDSADAEAVLRNDLANAVYEKLEQTIFGANDDDSGKRPVGMFSGATVNTISDFEDICELEAEVEDANVNGELKYVLSNKAKAVLRGMIKGTNATGMVYENGEVDGAPAFNTSAIGSMTSGGTQVNNVIVGDWKYLCVATWNGIDITVDPYTKAADGEVVLVINFFCDAKPLRKKAFAFGTI